MGERMPFALIDAAASGRMAVGEASPTCWPPPIDLASVKLSANWMAASGEPGEDADLYDTVHAVGDGVVPGTGGVGAGGQGLAVDAHALDGRRGRRPARSPHRCPWWSPPSRR